MASDEEEQQVFGLGAEEQPLVAVVEGEQHFFGLANISSVAEDNSVAGVAQHEGSPIVSISVQRHSARPRAAFHWARGYCSRMRGVDRGSSRGLSGICEWVFETCAIAAIHLSACCQLQVFGQGRILKYRHSMNPCEIGCGERHTQGVCKGAIAAQKTYGLANFF